MNNNQTKSILINCETGEKYDLNKDRTIIGSKDTCDIVIKVSN